MRASRRKTESIGFGFEKRGLRKYINGKILRPGNPAVSGTGLSFEDPPIGGGPDFLKRNN